MGVVEASRNELREKLSQVDVIIQKTEIERDEALETVTVLRDEKEKREKEREEEIIEREKEKKNFEKQLKIEREKFFQLKKENEGATKAAEDAKKKFEDDLATAKHEGHQLVKRKLEEAEEAHQMELVRNFSLFWTILFSRFDRPLTLIFVFNIVYFLFKYCRAKMYRPCH